MKESELSIQIKNGDAISVDQIPVLDYTVFLGFAHDILQIKGRHCVNYFAYDAGNELKFIMCIADDIRKSIGIVSHTLAFQNINKPFLSLSRFVPAMQVFEREIHENFAIDYKGHLWLKPLRYPHNRADRRNTIHTYPFFEMRGAEVHEVGVGSEEAGLMEPEHFHFICKGDKVKMLEMQHGYQHRGVEASFLKKPSLLQRNLLAESIAGDTAVGHSLAFVKNMESLGGLTVNENTSVERCIALELERIANHVGSLGAMCAAVSYPLGSAGFGMLKTPILNFTQQWCRNRLGKGLIRTGGSHYPLDNRLKGILLELLDDFEQQFLEISEKALSSSTLYNRFEGCGKVDPLQLSTLGVVGLTARMCGISRDIRASHPFEYFGQEGIEPVLGQSGDVWARALLRRDEIRQSLVLIRKFVLAHDALSDAELAACKPVSEADLMPNHFSISMTEGWRGEIVHCAITGDEGELIQYKVKDSSLHNFSALELAIHNQEITDFPVNHKSFDLSYSGLDL